MCSFDFLKTNLFFFSLFGLLFWMVGGSGGEVGRVYGEGIFDESNHVEFGIFFTIIRGTLGPRAISNLEITWVVCKRSRVKWEGHLLFLTNEFADLAADRVASFFFERHIHSRFS